VHSLRYTSFVVYVVWGSHALRERCAKSQNAGVMDIQTNVKSSGEVLRNLWETSDVPRIGEIVVAEGTYASGAFEQGHVMFLLSESAHLDIYH
jgi:hypothetical protein